MRRARFKEKAHINVILTPVDRERLQRLADRRQQEPSPLVREWIRRELDRDERATKTDRGTAYPANPTVR